VSIWPPWVLITYSKFARLKRTCASSHLSYNLNQMVSPLLRFTPKSNLPPAEIIFQTQTPPTRPIRPWSSCHNRSPFPSGPDEKITRGMGRGMAISKPWATQCRLNVELAVQGTVIPMSFLTAAPMSTVTVRFLAARAPASHGMAWALLKTVSPVS
jgi:hypothetical protein